MGRKKNIDYKEHHEMSTVNRPTLGLVSFENSFEPQRQTWGVAGSLTTNKYDEIYVHQATVKIVHRGTGSNQL
jgi:hypothetical protein